MLFRSLSTKSSQSLQGLANRLQADNPAPYASYLKLPGLEIASASPELFLERKGRVIKSTPIKGTSKMDNFGEKDRAENVMIVDLTRNDMSKIAQKGSVHVKELFGVYEFPQVFQMISTIEAKLEENITFSDIIKALFPMGSMTGAPKLRAQQLIRDFENGERGVYSGISGVIGNDGSIEMAMNIRCLVFQEGVATIGVEIGRAHV